MSDLQVTYEETPNPATLKFIVNQEIADESVDFQEANQTFRSPLASKIFGFPWTDSVYIGSNFVSITKQDWVDWEVLREPLTGLIREHIARGEAVITKSEAPKNTGAQTSQLSDVEQTIFNVIEQEIRPAVAMDGGDVVFQKYENNIVYVSMHGACVGCPSSTATLKLGIEARLKEVVPEISEVLAI